MFAPLPRPSEGFTLMRPLSPQMMFDFTLDGHLIPAPLTPFTALFSLWGAGCAVCLLKGITFLKEVWSAIALGHSPAPTFIKKKQSGVIVRC